MGSGYFNAVRAAYASDHFIKVRSLDVGQTGLSKKATPQGSQFRVSVTVSFQLTEMTDGSSFSGGESVDHLVTTRESGDEPVVVLSDKNTGVSTASEKLVKESAADAAAVRRRDYKMTGPGTFTYS